MHFGYVGLAQFDRSLMDESGIMMHETGDTAIAVNTANETDTVNTANTADVETTIFEIHQQNLAGKTFASVLILIVFSLIWLNIEVQPTELVTSLLI